MLIHRRFSYLLLACSVVPLCIGTTPVSVVAKSLSAARSTEGESKPAEKNDQTTEQDNDGWLVHRRIRVSTRSFPQPTILFTQGDVNSTSREAGSLLSNASEHAWRNGLGAPLRC